MTDRHLTRPQIAMVCLSMTLLLTLPAYLYPTWGAVLGVAAPIPIGVAFLLGGRALGLAVSLVASAAAGFILGPSAAVSFLLETVLMGFILASGMGRGMDYLKLTILATGVVILAGMGQSAVRSRSWSAAPASMQTEMDKTLKNMESYLGQGADKDQPLLNPEQFRETMTAVFPALFVVGALLNSLFCALVIAGFTSSSLPERPPFSSLKLPDPLIWLFIILAFAGIWDSKALWGVPLGTLLVISFLYLLQGIAVAVEFAERRRVSSWIRLIVAVLVIQLPFFLAVFAVLGLLDFRFDFRRPRTVAT